MPDDLTKTAPQDAKRINLGQPHEISYWCRALDCTPTELRDAVRAVGDSVAAVRVYLSRD